MSLFIGSLAFEESGLGYSRPDRLGIIIGSLASGVFGYLIIRFGSGSEVHLETNEENNKEGAS